MTTAAPADLDRTARLGLGCFEWVRFAESPAGPHNPDWKPVADQVAAAAKSRELRISAIGAFYQNPLDPRQTEQARAILKRAIEVAAYLGIKTVAAFPGAIMATRFNERAATRCTPFENHPPGALGNRSPRLRRRSGSGPLSTARSAASSAGDGVTLDPPAVWNGSSPPSTPTWGSGDPSHLLCQFIDPVANLKQFVSRVFHACEGRGGGSRFWRYGLCHPGVAEHLPGWGSELGRTHPHAARTVTTPTSTSKAGTTRCFGTTPTGRATAGWPTLENAAPHGAP
jgi:hypothetical protein